MRVPEEYLKADDAELVVKVSEVILGKLESSKRLRDLPSAITADRR